jgi:hypothetical protein
MAAASGGKRQSPKKSQESAIKDADLSAYRVIENAKPEDRVPILRGMIETAAKRLVSVVDKETEALRTGAKIDLKGFNGLKSMGLIELNRAIQLLEGSPPDESTIRVLRLLNEKLEANRRVLKLHMEAVNEIAGIISDSIREADSDGTYSFSFRSKEQKP